MLGHRSASHLPSALERHYFDNSARSWGEAVDTSAQVLLGKCCRCCTLVEGIASEVGRRHYCSSHLQHHHGLPWLL